MKCVLLCAGFGTRLYPITLNKPKSLLEIKGKPLIEHIIEKIPNEVDEIFIVTSDNHYLKFIWWLEKFKKKNKRREKIKIINDNTTSLETRLGGVGDLWFVIQAEKIQDDILVIAGDNLFDFDLQELINFFKKKKATIAVIYDVKNLEEAKKFSDVEIKDNKLTSWEEKPEEPNSTLSSIGIYIFSKEDLKKIGEYMKTDKPKDGAGFLIGDFCKKQGVCAFFLKGRWYDIGSHEIYDYVKENW